MADAPWLTIIGLNEDGRDGLSNASRKALSCANIIIAPPRHMALIADINPDAERRIWPVPFKDGLDALMALRGQMGVVILASGDPFCYGAGSVMARHLRVNEWQSFPAPSTFSLAANALGWPLEQTICLGLHALPFAQLRPHLAQDTRLIVLLRDGAAVHELCQYLTGLGFGESTVWALEALGGPHARITQHCADNVTGAFTHPVCVAIHAKGLGIPKCSGIPDALFATDGVMTKRPIRALTLSALAPRGHETLWDIGGGSGSIAIEWLLAHPQNRAVIFENRHDRIAYIRQNADDFGVLRLQIVAGQAPEVLSNKDLAAPDAVFIGGGLSAALLDHLAEHLPKGVRIVANAVTLEGEAALHLAQTRFGGSLLRVDLSESVPLGSKHAWKPAYPVVQWSAVL